MSIIELEGAGIAPTEGAFGDPIVMVHATASCGAQWRDLRRHLQGHHPVVTPDLWGHGETGPWPGARPLTMADEVALIDAAAARAGTPFHLVGHSYGGAVALRYALDHPGALRSLTLIEPVVFHLLRQGGLVDQLLFGEIRKIAGAVADGLVSGDHDRALRCFVDYWSGSGTWARVPAERRRALCERIATIAGDFEAVMGEQTPLEAYRGIPVPSLVLAGDQSPATTRRIAEILASTLPVARLQTVAGAGHMAPLSHRDAVQAAIEAQIDRTCGVPQAA